MRKTNTKKFDAKLKLEMDKVSLWARQSFFEQKKCSIETNSIRETSGDFVIVHPERGREIVESEVKIVWTRSGEWQGYPTVDVPFRKTGRVDALWYMMLNNSCDTLCITRMSHVRESKSYRKNTIYTKDEKFLAVDPCLFKWFTLDSNDRWIEFRGQV